MDRQTPVLDVFDSTQKDMAVSFRETLNRNIGFYLADAIRAANTKAGLSPKEFWTGLGYPSLRRDGKTAYISESYNKIKTMPDDPYSVLDLQACNKYLLFGCERVDPATLRPGGLKDSLNFFKFFGIAYSQKGPKEDYRNLLNRSIALRNDKAHIDQSSFAEISPLTLADDVQLLKELTQDLAKVPGWEKDRKPLSAYWKAVDAEYYEKFGAAPISLEELGEEIFAVDDDLSDEQRRALQDAAAFCGLKLEGGYIYSQPDRRILLERLTVAKPIAKLLGSRAAESADEAEALANRVIPAAVPAAATAPGPAVLRPFPQAVNSSLLDVLHSNRPLSDGDYAMLARNFTFLYDESIFLSEDGRNFITRFAIPYSKSNNRRIQLDYSVAATLCRKKRQAKKAGAMSSALLDQLYTPEERRAAEAEREENRRLYNAAMGLLRDLRRRKLLQTVYSPSTSTSSFDNLKLVIEQFPGTHFLVWTYDNLLVDAIAGMPGKNAVAVKPRRGNCLWFYSKTAPIMEEMLSHSAPAPAPAVPRSREPAVTKPAERPETPVAPQTPPSEKRPRTEKSAARDYAAGQAPVQEPVALKVTSLPGTGAAVLLRRADGSEHEIRLRAQLGMGGEGQIYATDDADTVVKIYKPERLDTARRDKVTRMVQANPSIKGLCWPKELAYNSRGEWVGFAMPKAEGEQLAMTIFHPSRIESRGWTRENVVRVAAGIAEIFAAMHARNILMGDINPSNILIGPDFKVYFVDCDSYQFGGYRCRVGTVTYTPPEILRLQDAEHDTRFDYVRTLSHEKYSMAVLLFGTIMLGKMPFECTNPDQGELVHAIIAGEFPYPFNSGADDDQRPRSKRAPVGKWRQIWSHTSYAVKETFYKTFANGERASAARWKTVLEQYADLIRAGRSSNELAPSTYKVVQNADGSEVTRMVDCVCEICGEKFNIDEETYNRRRRNGDKELCSMHWEMRGYYRSRTVSKFCAKCGKRFDILVSDWTAREQNGVPLLCENCDIVRCSDCRKPISLNHYLKARSNNKTPYCEACYNKHFPTVTCERCGKKITMNSEKLRDLRARGKEVMCSSCFNAFRNTW